MKQTVNILSLFIIFNLFCLNDSFSQTGPDLYNQGTTPPSAIFQIIPGQGIKRWVLTFNDEFNDTLIDTDKWWTNYPYGNNYSPTTYSEWMTKDNIEFDDGKMKLIAKDDGIYARGIGYYPDDTLLDDGMPNLRQWEYTSGMVYSKRHFRYGLFEISCKLPAEQGAWPAFWLHNGNPWGEFDIFEFKGETPSRFHIDTHCPSGCSSPFAYSNPALPIGPTSWIPVTQPLSNGFNNFMGEWGPEASYFYFNFQDFAQWIGSFDGPMYLISNLGLSAIPFDPNSDGFGGTVDASTNFPHSMEIDYIRVWNEYNCINNLVLGNYSHSSLNEPVITGSSVEIDNLSVPESEYLTIVAEESIIISDTSNVFGTLETILVDCPLTSGISTNEPDGFQASRTHELETTEQSSTTLLTQKTHPLSLDSETRNPLFLKVYPNPTSEMITVTFNGNTSIEPMIRILNGTGQEVLNLTPERGAEKLQIQLSHLPTGFYQLVCTYQDYEIRENIIIR